MIYATPVQKLIILDRDGVINYDSPYYIKSPDEWRAIPGSLQAISRLTKAGFKIAVATNQSGIARGLYNAENLAAIHAKMANELAKVGGTIDKIVYCPHAPEDGCACRKPQTLLLIQIAEYFGCSLKNIPFIGDKMSDVQAAVKVGARPILISHRPPKPEYFHLSNLSRYPSLSAAVDAIIGEDHDSDS